MKLTIIIPVYNEAKNIRKAISEIESKIKTPHQILIIYDFDQDNTISEVKKLQRRNKNLKLIKNNIETKRGVLNAIKTGFAKVEEGAIVVTMADLSDDPATINQMFRKINEGFDIVCGSRYVRGGGKKGGPFLKSLLSYLAGLTTPLLLGIPVHDLTNAFKMYRKEVLKAIKIESAGGFELSEEILIKAYFKGFKITEVSTIWYDRTIGQSRFRIKEWLLKYIYWYFWGIGKRLGF
jgi:glycosyltransferase involved in cell wall biosynthesis